MCLYIFHLKIGRQTIRETWANMTEFNYPMFARMHANFNGSSLAINNPEWRKYAMQDEEENASEPSLSKFRVKIVFLIGQTGSNMTQMKIYEESEMHNDLIQESFLDSYNNLTLKTVMMLKWVNGSCADKGSRYSRECCEMVINNFPIHAIIAVQFLMKCDDDTFVNVPNLLHVLLGGTVPVYIATFMPYEVHKVHVKPYVNRLHYSMVKNLLMGHRFCHTKPIVNASSKWYKFSIYRNETVLFSSIHRKVFAELHVRQGNISGLSIRDGIRYVNRRGASTLHRFSENTIVSSGRCLSDW